MKLSTVKIALVSLFILHLPLAHAEVFIPLQSQTSLSLGSGVNLLRPAEGIPSCFDFTDKQLDPGYLSFKYSINAVSSIEEVNRIRRKGASVSGSYGATSAKLEAWQNSSSSDKKASLYVVIEARLVGPRIEASGLKPKLNRAELLEKGKPADIFKQCGTHVAMTEHRGQTLRIVVDMREADLATKQEVGAKFGASAKFGLFKAKASGNYMSSIEKLASDKKLEAVVEGSGTPPPPEAIINLLKTKAGDLNAVAQALNNILVDIGKNGTNVGFGLTLQPIHLFSPAAPDTFSSLKNVAALEALTENMDMLTSEKDGLNAERDVEGLSDEIYKALNDNIDKIRKLMADLKTDTEKCLFVKEDDKQSCVDIADTWKTRIRKSRNIQASIDVSDKIVLSTNLPLRSQGTLIATIDGKEIALDTFVFDKGPQSTTILAVEKPFTPTPAASIASTKPASLPTLPEPTLVRSSLPLTAVVGLMSAMIPAFEEKLNTVDYIHIGCYGVELRSSNGPSGSMTLKFNQAALSPDSICKSTLGLLLVPPVTVASYGPPNVPSIGLMPPGFDPITINSLKPPVLLKLVLIDRLGLETVHLLSSDCSKNFAKSMQLLEINHDLNKD